MTEEDQELVDGLNRMLQMADRQSEISMRYLTELFGVIKRAKSLEVVRQTAGSMHTRMMEEVASDIRQLEAIKVEVPSSG